MMTSSVISIKTIKEKMIPILKSYPVDKAVLLGSSVKDKAIYGSDIDLYIDTKK
ncbi:nucleotidyltransferase domain-containing protein [Clostridiisalibacter paucivorans]|uniref:nucleotidyltransferase domain-containing protein n=1 Tax=Clostridiisalibacter paucivorans TaxID=408753 RepID=UPI0012EC519E|nr:nucleotidyltransferase domain-containing protein [Clostridiisalibacter paucivorans]